MRSKELILLGQRAERDREGVWRGKERDVVKTFQLVQFIERKCGDLDFLHYFLNTQFHLAQAYRHKTMLFYLPDFSLKIYN